jgi:hypothetical protein
LTSQNNDIMKTRGPDGTTKRTIQKHVYVGRRLQRRAITEILLYLQIE